MVGDVEHFGGHCRADNMTEMRVEDFDVDSVGSVVGAPEPSKGAGLVSASTFRAVVAHSPTGVGVVTARDSNGRHHGITVSSYVSLSLEPPLLLICIDGRSRIHRVLCAATSFAISILSIEQEPLARQFASRLEDRFAGVPCSPGKSGDLLISNAVAFIECVLVNTVRGGDHSIFIGAVSAAGARHGVPLLCHRGAYTEPRIVRPVDL